MYHIIREQRAYLAGSKFQGVCENYISTHEVNEMLFRIEAALTGDPMNFYNDQPENVADIERMRYEVCFLFANGNRC